MLLEQMLFPLIQYGYDIPLFLLICEGVSLHDYELYFSNKLGLRNSFAALAKTRKSLKV